MQLLLSSDQLLIPSEDTVLYTAKQCVKAQRGKAAKAAAKSALAQLVCAPQLSLFAMRCAALPADSSQQLLGAWDQQLRDLLPLKIIAWQEDLAGAVEEMQAIPASWRLGPRQIRPLEDSVRLEWRLPVEQLKQACRDSFTQQKTVDIIGPRSAPLGGVAWRLKITCKQGEGGTMVGLYAGPMRLDVPASVHFKFKCSVVWQNAKRTLSSACLKGSSGWGYANYFKLQPVAGDGWDEAVWAAAGLPAAGDMLLELCVRNVL
jgi:hypothetical protein